MPQAAADDFPDLAHAAATRSDSLGYQAGKALAEIDRWRHSDEDVQHVYDIMMEDD